MNYSFADISVRPVLSMADMNNPWIFRKAKHVINVSGRYYPEIEIECHKRGCTYDWIPLSEHPHMEVDNLLRAVQLLRQYTQEDGHIIVHCMSGKNRSRTVVEALYYSLIGRHFTDEKGPYQNHLIYNCAQGFLPPLEEMERKLKDFESMIDPELEIIADKEERVLIDTPRYKIIGVKGSIFQEKDVAAVGLFPYKGLAALSIQMEQFLAKRGLSSDETAYYSFEQEPDIYFSTYLGIGCIERFLYEAGEHGCTSVALNGVRTGGYSELDNLLEVRRWMERDTNSPIRTVRLVDLRGGYCRINRIPPYDPSEETYYLNSAERDALLRHVRESAKRIDEYLDKNP